MGEIARGADGRRLFTPEFKKQQIDRVLRGDLTLSELTRELVVSASVARLAIAFGVLSLEFYSIEQTPQATIAIGKEIVKALRRQGFRPDWDRTAPKNFILVPMDWKRRRHSVGRGIVQRPSQMSPVEG